MSLSQNFYVNLVTLWFFHTEKSMLQHHHHHQQTPSILLFVMHDQCWTHIKKHMKTSCGQGLKISSDKKDCVELDCRDSGCMNGGRCLSHSLGFKCKCPKSYAGKFCEAEASPYGSIHASLGFIVTLIACASSLICKYYMFTQFISFRYDDDSISSRQRGVHHWLKALATLVTQHNQLVKISHWNEMLNMSHVS